MPVRGLLLDLDGTIWEDGTPLPGAVEAIGRLRAGGLSLAFATNATSRSRRLVAERLTEAGIPARTAEVWNAPAAGAAVLAATGISRIHLLSAPGCQEDLAAFEEDGERPDAVVVGDAGEGFTFEAMNRAFRCLLGGARLVALARNRYWKKGGRLVLDCGPYVAALEEATGVRAVLAGKPSRAFFAGALALLGLPASDVAMVGDDAESDVAGAKAFGMMGFLVRTGKYRPGDEALATPPDRVLDSLADAERLL